jgi:hypothetical protein
MADKPIQERKYNEDVDIETMLEEGAVLAKIFIEVQGNDKKTAKQALEVTINDNLLKETRVSLLEVKMFDLAKYGDKDKKKDYFSGVAEIRIIAEDFPSFLNLVMRYGPTAIEIIKPQEVKLDYDQMHTVVSDASAMAQVYSTKIMTMLKDPERKLIYDTMLGERK